MRRDFMLCVLGFAIFGFSFIARPTLADSFSSKTYYYQLDYLRPSAGGPAIINLVFGNHIKLVEEGRPFFVPP